jgi:hypothetical protein
MPAMNVPCVPTSSARYFEGSGLALAPSGADWLVGPRLRASEQLLLEPLAISVPPPESLSPLWRGGRDSLKATARNQCNGT